MTAERAAAVAALCDPGLPAADLVRIAGRWPSLWRAVAEHPAAYPTLLQWLAQHGDASVLAVVTA